MTSSRAADWPETAEQMAEWWETYVRVTEADASPMPQALRALWPAGTRDEEKCADPPPVRVRPRLAPADVTRAERVQGWLCQVLAQDARWRVSRKAVQATYLRAAGLDGFRVARRVGCRNCRMQYKRWRDGLMDALLAAAKRERADVRAALVQGLAQAVRRPVVALPLAGRVR